MRKDISVRSQLLTTTVGSHYRTTVQVRRKFLTRVINQALTEHRIHFETNALPCYLLSHTHWFAYYWSCWIAWLSIGMALWLPLRVALPESEWNYFHLFADLNFVVDIAVTGVTTYFDPVLGKEEVSVPTILKHYSKTRLVYDVVGAIPTTLLEGVRGLQLLKLLKLKNNCFLRSGIQRKMGLGYRFLRLTIWLVLGLHWTACSWLCLCMQQQRWEPGSFQGTEFYTVDWVTQYAFAVYAAIGLLIGIELMPQTAAEVIFCSCGLFLGAFATAILFGEMAIIIKQHRKSFTEFETMLQQCHTTMQGLKLKRTIQDNVLDYLVSVQNQISQQTESQKFEKVLAPSLLASVNAVLYNDFLVKTRVFSEYPEYTKCLLWNLKTLHFNPEDCIFRQDDSSDSMYFCQAGTVSIQITMDSPIQVNVVGPGRYFGELGVIFKRKRTASAQARSYTTVGQISAKVFDGITHHFATLKHALMQQAYQYRDPLTMFLKEAISSVPFLKPLSKLQFLNLLFSVKKARYRKDQSLLEFDEVCSRVYFLAEGSLTVQFELCGRQGVESVRNNVYQQGVLYSRHPTKRLAWAQILSGSSVTFPVARVSSRSVLMAYNTVLGLPSKIRLKAATDCTCYMLDLQTINETIQAYSGNLSANLSLVRAFFENPCENLKVPILDFHCVPAEQKQSPLLRLRHAALKIIHYVRVRRSKTANLSDLVVWLVRIAKSAGMSWSRLRHQLESRNFSKPLKDLVCVLTTEVPSSLGKPLSKVAQDSLFEVCMIADQLTQFDRLFSAFSSQDKSLEESFQDCECLMAELDKMIDSTKRTLVH